MHSECIIYILMNAKHAEGGNQVGLYYISSWESLMEESQIFIEWMKRKNMMRKIYILKVGMIIWNHHVVQVNQQFNYKTMTTWYIAVTLLKEKLFNI